MNIAHIGMAVTFNIAAGNITHIGMNIALHIALDFNVALVGLDTLGVSIHDEFIAIFNIEVVNISLYCDIDLLFIGVNALQFVKRLAVNQHFPVNYGHSATAYDGGAFVVSDYSSHFLYYFKVNFQFIINPMFQ
jgi:hypothetical protein